MKKYWFSLLALLAAPALRAQTFNQQHLLNKPCPNIPFTNTWQFPPGKTQLTHFKGTPLVLYFFSLRCLACLRTLPAVDSLQRRMGNKVNILLVGKEPLADVQKAFQTRNSLRQVQLPVLAADTAFHNVFKHLAVPHVVLINSRGIVRAITGQLTESTLRSLLNNQILRVTEKRDAIGKNPDDPMLFTDYTYQKSLHPAAFFAYITPANKATATMYGVRTDDSNNICRWMDVGRIVDLYARVNPALRGINPSRVLGAATPDTTFYAFDYLNKKKQPAHTFFAHAQQVLDDFFGYNSTVSSEMVKCWIIKTAPGGATLKPPGKKWQLDFEEGNMYLTNGSWQGFVELINGVKLLPPVQLIDETGIRPATRLNIHITENINSLPAMQASLAQSGLILVEEYRSLPCIVLRKTTP